MIQQDHPKGVLQSIQVEIATRLAVLADFASVPVFTENTEDVDNRIAVALGPLVGQAAKSGVCALVLTPRCANEKQNLPGPFLNATIIVQLIENILSNQSDTGTKLPASYLAEIAARGLHHYHTAAKKTVIVTGITLIPPSDAFPGHVLYNVSATIDVPLDPLS